MRETRSAGFFSGGCSGIDTGFHSIPVPAPVCCCLQAKDALHVMDGRLSGTLLGVLSTPSLPLSCEGQAARLIDEATDHENLGRMYIWWMPWM